MPELAPIQTQPPQGSCPTAEDLACYIDGALSPEEAARVTEHLASCESCFEVYSEVLQFQLESVPAEDTEPETGKVVRFPVERRRPPVVRWASIAALLVVGLGFGIYSYLFAPPSPLVTADLAAPVQSKTGLAESLWRGVVTRGPGEEIEPGNELSPEKAAFRIGVQIVNLQIALAANNVKNSQDARAGIYRVLRTQSFTGDLPTSYEQLAGAIEKAKSPKDLLPRASQLAKELSDYLDPLYFDLGQWVEAGRLAAISHDPAFFRQPGNRSFLRHSLWRDRFGFEDSKLPAGSRAELEDIYKISDQGTLKSADFVKLQGHFKKILELNYPE
jgi:putative zinc finger protein